MYLTSMLWHPLSPLQTESVYLDFPVVCNIHVT